MAKRLLTFLMMLLMLGALGTVAGCNTMAGAGKDIQRGGEKIHDEAREVQQKM
jgi:entericidin B